MTNFGDILVVLEDYQAFNVAVGGIAFSEEGFTQLHDKVLESLDQATVVSFALGVALTSGLVLGGAMAYKSVKNKSKLKSKKGEK